MFRDTVQHCICSGSVLLDLGAGSGMTKEMNFKGLVQKVYGIDPDPRVLDNPFLDIAFVGTGNSMPMFSDNQFDIIVCCNVLEHIKDPQLLFQEINRVLKPDGLFLAKTSNQFHYVPFVAKIASAGFRNSFFKKYGLRHENTFPTLYRINSAAKQKQVAFRTGFEIVQIDYFEGRPEYLRHNPILYFVGIIYERLVNLLHLHRLKVVMITKFRKV